MGRPPWRFLSLDRHWNMYLPVWTQILIWRMLTRFFTERTSFKKSLLSFKNSAASFLRSLNLSITMVLLNDQYIFHLFYTKSQLRKISPLFTLFHYTFLGSLYRWFFFPLWHRFQSTIDTFELHIEIFGFVLFFKKVVFVLRRHFVSPFAGYPSAFWFELLVKGFKFLIELFINNIFTNFLIFKILHHRKEFFLCLFYNLDVFCFLLLLHLLVNIFLFHLWSLADIFMNFNPIGFKISSAFRTRFQIRGRNLFILVLSCKNSLKWSLWLLLFWMILLNFLWKLFFFWLSHFYSFIIKSFVIFWGILFNIWFLRLSFAAFLMFFDPVL